MTITIVISTGRRNLSFVFVLTDPTTRSLACARDDRPAHHDEGKGLSFRTLRLSSVQAPREIHVSTARRNLSSFPDLTTRSLTGVYAEFNEVFEMTGFGQP